VTKSFTTFYLPPYITKHQIKILKYQTDIIKKTCKKPLNDKSHQLKPAKYMVKLFSYY